MEALQDMEYRDKIIDIFGSKWQIKFVDKIEVEDDSDVDGLTDSTNRIISVSTSQSKNEVNITLFHELIHAMLNTGQYLNTSKDEPMVEFLARSFNSLIEQGVIQWNP